MTNRPVEVPGMAVQAGEAPLGWVERCVWTDRMVETLRKGGPEGGRWYWLHDKVFSERTLRVAYKQVAANKGAPGVDGVTVEAFGKRLDEEIERLLRAWKAGTYRPQAIRRTWIPKPGTVEKRPLGIPTVRDRVVQAALKMVLEPIFDLGFSEHSHGFRPGHSCHHALNEVLGYLRRGHVWVVDADLKSYFDTIPHERLVQKVHDKVTDRRILELIQQFLSSGIMEQGEQYESYAGTPQGGVISPLLANLYLDELDHEMAQSGYAMVRYADDFVVLCCSREEAEGALEQVRNWTAEAGLVLHPTKTHIVDLGQERNYFDFLGFRLQAGKGKSPKGGLRVLRLVRPKSLTRVKDAVRSLTPRMVGIGLEVVIGRLNRVLRGWFRYFRSALVSIHRALDQTIRRRLRAILEKRRKRRRRNGKGRAHNRWPNAYLAKLGLFSLEAAHSSWLHSCRGIR